MKKQIVNLEIFLRYAMKKNKMKGIKLSINDVNSIYLYFLDNLFIDLLSENVVIENFGTLRIFGNKSFSMQLKKTIKRTILKNIER